MSVQSDFSLNNCYREHLFIKYDEIQIKADAATQSLTSEKMTGNLADYKPISKEQAGEDLAVIEAYRKRSNVHICDQVTISQDAQEAAARYQAAKQKGINAEAMGDLIIDPTASHEQRIDSINNFGSTRFESGMHTTTKNGTVIGVYTAPLNDESTHTKYVQITQPSGVQAQLVLSENMKITEHEDGSLSVLYGDSHKKMTIHQDGTTTTSIDAEDSFSGTSGDDILINLNGSTVDGKEGDDIIFNLADDVQILGGEGDDRILAPGKVNNMNLDSGTGNDSIHVGIATNSTITAGEGDNSLYVYKAFKSQITAGEGNNKAVFDEIRENSNVMFGNGNNSIYTRMLGNALFRDGEYSSASQITVGSGNNTVSVNQIAYSAVKFGNGDNVFKFNSMHAASVYEGNNTRWEKMEEKKSVEEKKLPQIDFTFGAPKENIHVLTPIK